MVKLKKNLKNKKSCSLIQLYVGEGCPTGGGCSVGGNCSVGRGC